MHLYHFFQLQKKMIPRSYLRVWDIWTAVFVFNPGCLIKTAGAPNSTRSTHGESRWIGIISICIRTSSRNWLVLWCCILHATSSYVWVSTRHHQIVAAIRRVRVCSIARIVWHRHRWHIHWREDMTVWHKIRKVWYVDLWIQLCNLLLLLLDRLLLLYRGHSGHLGAVCWVWAVDLLQKMHKTLSS